MPNRHPSRTTLTLSAACTIGAIAIAGCGGGNDNSEPSTASTSSFVSQADAICADVTAQSAGLASPTNEMSSLAEYTKSELAIIKPAVGEMHALTPPEGQQSEFHAYVTALENEIELEKGLYDAATEGDAHGVDALLKDVQALGTVKKAAALGLTECAKGA
jgi:hypothetical protein